MYVRQELEIKLQIGIVSPVSFSEERFLSKNNA